MCVKDKIKAATLAKHREEEVVVLCGVKQKLKKEIVSATMYKLVMTGQERNGVMNRMRMTMMMDFVAKRVMTMK